MTYRSRIEESVLEFGIALQKLISQEVCVLDVLEERYVNGVVLEMWEDRRRSCFLHLVAKYGFSTTPLLLALGPILVQEDFLRDSPIDTLFDA